MTVSALISASALAHTLTGTAQLPEAVIFDVDGTLLQSNGIWVEVDRRFFTSRGLAIPPTYVEDIEGMRYSQIAEYTIRLLPAALQSGLTPASVMDEWNATAHQMYTEVAWTAGAHRLIASLVAAGVKVAVATALPGDLLCVLLARPDCPSALVLEHCVTCEEVGAAKPDPRVYVTAASRIAADPRRCVAFEDTLKGANAAIAAGMRVFGMRDEITNGHVEAELAKMVAGGKLIDCFESLFASAEGA
jgi:HAD superfamily hydrolase (TIGR01509 family)